MCGGGIDTNRQVVKPKAIVDAYRVSHHGRINDHGVHAMVVVMVCVVQIHARTHF